MKIFLSVLGLMLAQVAAIAQNNNYNLKGRFKSATADGVVYMRYESGGKAKKDSAIVRNGTFEFKGPFEEPKFVYLNYKRPNIPADQKNKNQDGRSMYLDKGTVVLHITDSLKTARISGSVVNADYKKYEEVLNVKEGKDAAIVNYISENPNSYFLFKAMYQLAGSYFDIDKVEPVFNGFSEKRRKSKEGLTFDSLITSSKSITTGKMAPDFAHEDMNGKIVKLSDFKGKYVLVDFWASWCGPCRRENPNVLKAFNAFKDKNFTVLGISVDKEKDRAKWLKAVEEDKMSWIQLIDCDDKNKNRAQDSYVVRAIPSNFLIDPNGKIIAKNLRGEALEKKLVEVIQ